MKRSEVWVEIPQRRRNNVVSGTSSDDSVIIIDNVDKKPIKRNHFKEVAEVVVIVDSSSSNSTSASSSSVASSLANPRHSISRPSLNKRQRIGWGKGKTTGRSAKYYNVKEVTDVQLDDSSSSYCPSQQTASSSSSTSSSSTTPWHSLTKSIHKKRQRNSAESGKKINFKGKELKRGLAKELWKEKEFLENILPIYRNLVQEEQNGEEWIEEWVNVTLDNFSIYDEDNRLAGIQSIKPNCRRHRWEGFVQFKDYGKPIWCTGYFENYSIYNYGKEQFDPVLHLKSLHMESGFGVWYELKSASHEYRRIYNDFFNCCKFIKHVIDWLSECPNVHFDDINSLFPTWLSKNVETLLPGKLQSWRNYCHLNEGRYSEMAKYLNTELFNTAKEVLKESFENIPFFEASCFKDFPSKVDTLLREKVISTPIVYQYLSPIFPNLEKVAIKKDYTAIASKHKSICAFELLGLREPHFPKKVFEDDSKEYFDHVTLGDTRLSLGECVVVNYKNATDAITKKEEENWKASTLNERVWIGRVLKIWRSKSKPTPISSGVDVSWFYFAWDTEFGDLVEADPQEVFYTHHHDSDIPLEAIDRKATVHVFSNEIPTLKHHYYCNTFYDPNDVRFTLLTENNYPTKMESQLHPKVANDRTPFWIYSDNPQDEYSQSNGFQPNNQVPPKGFYICQKLYQVGDAVLLKPFSPLGKKERGFLEYSVATIESIEISSLQATPLVKLRCWYPHSGLGLGLGVQDRIFHNELLWTNQFFYLSDLQTIHNTCYIQFVPPWEELPTHHPLLYGGVGRMYFFRAGYNQILSKMIYFEQEDHISKEFQLCYPDHLKLAKDMFQPLSVMELFCGAGGTSCGIEDTQLLQPKWGIEIDGASATTMKENHPNCDVIQEDCIDVLEELLKKRTKNSYGIPLKDMGVISCGPPCQGFSLMNCNKDSEKSQYKSSLVTLPFSYVELLRPKYFIFENVKSLVDYKKSKVLLSGLLYVLHKLGYQLAHYVLCAGNYGIAQRRDRLIIIAADKSVSLPFLPYPSHHIYTLQQHASYCRAPSTNKRKVIVSFDFACFPQLTVKDTIGHLPKIGDGSYICFKDFEHQVKKLCKRDQDIVNHIPKEKDSKAIESLKNEYGQLILPKKMLENEEIGYRRHLWNGMFDTITGALVVTGNSMRLRRLHPEEHRVLSIREAALAQGYPASYNFFGSIQQKYQMIGNSVPPPLAFAIGMEIVKSYVEDECHKSKTSAPRFCSGIGI